MGTCNFRGCGRFGLWTCIEEYDEDYYREEYPDEEGYTDDQRYAIYIENARDWYEYYAHGMQDALDELNARLVFHELEVTNGYYEGIEIVLKPKYEPRSCQGWYAPEDRDGWEYIALVYDAMEGACYGEHVDDPKFQRRCRAKFEAECDVILDWLVTHAEEWGFYPMGCVARFDNGEAWYSRTDSLPVLDHDIGMDIGFGDHDREVTDWERDNLFAPLWACLETPSQTPFTEVTE